MVAQSCRSDLRHALLPADKNIELAGEAGDGNRGAAYDLAVDFDEDSRAVERFDAEGGAADGGQFRGRREEPAGEKGRDRADDFQNGKHRNDRDIEQAVVHDSVRHLHHPAAGIFPYAHRDGQRTALKDGFPVGHHAAAERLAMQDIGNQDLEIENLSALAGVLLEIHLPAHIRVKSDPADVRHAGDDRH